MRPQCEKAIAEYLACLQENFIIVTDGPECLLVTPFARLDGEYIELRVFEKPSGEVVITDDCSTSDYLFLNGLTLEGNDELIKEAGYIAFRHQVDFVSSELLVTVPESQIGDGLHRLISATLAVSDLVYKRRHRTISTFNDEVENFFLSHDIPVARNFEVVGLASTHNITFYLDSKYNWLVEPLSVLSVQAARNRGKLIAYQWMDIENAGHRYTCTVILDDSKDQWEKFWSREDLAKPVFDYSDVVFRWSEIDLLPNRLYAT